MHARKTMIEIHQHFFQSAFHFHAGSGEYQEKSPTGNEKWRCLYLRLDNFGPDNSCRVWKGARDIGLLKQQLWHWRVYAAEANDTE